MGMPALAMTDHGNVFGAYEFWKKAKQHGVKPIIGIEAYVTPGHPPLRQDPGALGRRRPSDDVSGSRRLHPHDPAARETHRGHAQPVPDVVAGHRSRATTSSRGWTASCCSTYGQGLIATTGCPSGEVQTRLRLGQYDEAVRGGRRVPGHLRRGELLLRAHGPRPRHRAPRHEGPAPAGQGPRPAAGRHQRPALHAAPRTPRRTPRCCACSPARRWTTRTGSSSTPTSSTSRPPPQMRHAVARAARGLRQHPADRRALRGRVHRGRELHAALPRARTGETETVLVRQGGRARACTAATPAASRTTCASRPSTRSTSSCQMGFPGYFLVVADFINWAKDNGIRVGPGRGSGAGSMAAYAMRHHRPRPARSTA